MLNKRILVLIFLLVFLPLVGCFPSPAPPITENQAPIITSIPITSVTVGETYVYDVKATDPDGDTLTYSLSTKPTGMTIGPATGLIKWTPKAKGNYAVTVKVSDGALSDTQSFTIVVSKPSAPPPVNHAPIIASIPDLATIVGIQYIYEVKATDPDGDVLTYSLTVKPGDMAIDSGTGKITWIPTAVGDYNVAVEVSDGKLSDSQSFTIEVSTVEITGIEVKPDEMTIVVGGSEAIKSVTATYEIKTVFEAPIALGDCTFTSDATLVATVNSNFEVEAGVAGEATITVTYAGKTDEIVVTVNKPVHNIDTDLYYDTIQAAINDGLTLDDHTIEVAPGTYSENIIIDKSLTVVSTDGAEDTTIDAQTALYAVLINGVSTVATFEGFTVRNYEECGILAGAFSLDDDPFEVHMLNNIVEEPGPLDEHNNCIQVGDGTTGTVVGNEVSGALLVDPDWSGSGILVAGSNDVLISDNYVHDCELGIAIAGYAFSRVAPAENNLVENNLVENCEVGISVEMKSIDTIIRYNDVFDNDVGIESAGNIYWEPNIPSGTEIHSNNIVGNVNYGVESLVWDSTLGDPEQVDATYNWWGSEYGPKHNGFPVNGGDAVSDNVDYEHFLTSEY